MNIDWLRRAVKLAASINDFDYSLIPEAEDFLLPEFEFRAKHFRFIRALTLDFNLQKEELMHSIKTTLKINDNAIRDLNESRWFKVDKMQPYYVKNENVFPLKAGDSYNIEIKMRSEFFEPDGVLKSVQQICRENRKY